jgi:hypothetical protein
MRAVKELTDRSYPGLIAATAQFDDEVKELEQAGVNGAFNFYAEAGRGFAEHVCQSLDDECRLEPAGKEV